MSPSVERHDRSAPITEPSPTRPERESDWADEGDDDDMDFEMTTDDNDDGEEDGSEDDEDEDADDDTIFHDAEQELSGVEIEFSLADGDPAEDQDAEIETDPPTEPQPPDTPRPTPRVSHITHRQLLQILRPQGLGRLLFQRSNHRARGADDDDEEYDEDDGGDGDYGLGSSRARRRRRTDPRRQSNRPKVPSQAGVELMNSGVFGCHRPSPPQDIGRRKKIATRLLRRELGLDIGSQESRQNKLMAQELLPTSRADMIIKYRARCYSGQFSDDGNFFFSCAQDFKVRMYDTSNPYDWKYYKTVECPYGRWTITDASLSPDNRFLAYSSIRPIVCLASTDPNEPSQPWLLDFSHTRPSRHRGQSPSSDFGIWSVRFSGDGREIVAGTGDDSVYVYDLETRQSVLRIHGHEEDVNAVCFGDSASPHILYSGSDDTTLKVWDRRSMGDSREAGVFLGHTEGLTYVDSKGDGRYVLSNGKDQTMKLWDLRKMMSTDRFDRLDTRKYSTEFDYRFMPYEEADYTPHPHDCSLVTFYGHRVLKTLIRCHFSPAGSTDSRYVYSGSEDGSVYIYNLDATLAGKVNVYDATRVHRPRERGSERYVDWMGRTAESPWKTCVRDASWHPNAPVIAGESRAGDV
ncbi:MAG: hypothetical protein M1817_003872 [Caeruleum heppii]|nr:MAG: hypothetical protein M1817_003872 [Caeruleum heppii]